MKRIGYQGIPGSYSHLTALRDHSAAECYIGNESFRELFCRLMTGSIDAALLPIENSLIGSIYENYDLLDEHGGHIAAEHYTKVEHCLLALHGVKLKEIRQVLSHPKALEQCGKLFIDHPWLEPVTFVDTAAAALHVSKLQNPTLAALGSSAAGEMYDLSPLLQSVGDNVHNYTRFVTVTATKTDQEAADKCSIAFTLKHEPSRLLEALHALSEQGVNITRIESRPIQGLPFEYRFYLDFEWEGLPLDLDNVKVLGRYKRAVKWMS